MIGRFLWDHMRWLWPVYSRLHWRLQAWRAKAQAIRRIIWPPSTQPLFSLRELPNGEVMAFVYAEAPLGKVEPILAKIGEMCGDEVIDWFVEPTRGKVLEYCVFYDKDGERRLNNCGRSWGSRRLGGVGSNRDEWVSFVEVTLDEYLQLEGNGFGNIISLGALPDGSEWPDDLELKA